MTTTSLLNGPNVILMTTADWWWAPIVWPVGIGVSPSYSEPLPRFCWPGWRCTNVWPRSNQALVHVACGGGSNYINVHCTCDDQYLAQMYVYSRKYTKMYKKFVFRLEVSRMILIAVCWFIFTMISTSHRECFRMPRYFLFVNWTNKETQNRLRRGSNVDAILGSNRTSH